MTTTSTAALWWQQPELLSRWSRDLLCTEMAQLRPAGWPWPVAHDAADMHLVRDAAADSLELLALSSAWAERLDLRDEDELQLLMQQPSWQGWQAAALARLRRGDAVLRFATSGSTGRAQTVLHPLAELQQEVDCIAERLCSGDPPIRRIVSVVRAHHIYGFLFTVLLPLALGQRRSGQALAVVDAVQESPALVRQRLQPGDLLVAFPDWWALAVRGAGSWPSGVTGVSSTAPCPLPVAQAAQAAGLARWVEVYGSTETAGVGWREDPTQPFELQPYWQRVTPQEQADDEAPALLQRLEAHGRTGPAVATPDRLEWRGPRHFTPTGRRDGVVQVGGVNVDPAEVARRLCGHPRVAEASVRLQGQASTAATGTARLKAFVVPRAGSSTVAPNATVVEELRTELEAWCRTHFVPAARPVHIRVGTHLPRNEMGKLCDWDLSG